MLDQRDQQVAGVHPDAVGTDDVSPDDVRAALDSTDPVVRGRACRTCETLAARDLDAVRPLVPDLGAALADDSLAVVRAALSALTTVAESDPGALEPCVDDLVDATDTDLNGVLLEAGQCLSAVAADRPETCVPHASRLVRTLSEGNGVGDQTDHAEAVVDPETRRTIRAHERSERRDGETARQLLANVVVAAAETAPDAFQDGTAGVTELLGDDDSTVVAAGLAALSAVAREDPAAVPVDDRLFDCLDHESRAVRARAVQTFGFLEADAVCPALERIAATDDDDDVAALAAETAAFLEG